LPTAIDWARVPGLSREVREKLTQVQPGSIGQASRIPGVTPAAVSILMVQARAGLQAAQRRLTNKEGE